MGKGPSLDLWVARGYEPLPEGSIVMAINENVMLPGLAADYWFWYDTDTHPWAEKVGAPPPGTIQVVPEQHFRQIAGVAARPSLIYIRGADADDDPWAVPGRATPAGAAFFCAGLWGCRHILAVGFDGLDNPTMKSYPRCLRQWLIDSHHLDRTYAPNNRGIEVAISRFDLQVTWFHREVSEREIAEAHASFEDD